MNSPGIKGERGFDGIPGQRGPKNDREQTSRVPEVGEGNHGDTRDVHGPVIHGIGAGRNYRQVKFYTLLSTSMHFSFFLAFRIETHVTAAAQQVESGRDQLQKAEKHKKSARRMKFILAAILAGVATVLIILLAIFL